MSVGVAAHITAAAEGGPRYDPTMTPEQRSSIDNGIHVCHTHSRLIDGDSKRYTVDVLRGWKARSEALAQAELEMGERRGAEPRELPPLYVDNQFNNHRPLHTLNREIEKQGFKSGWVKIEEVEAKRTLGWVEHYFEGHEVRSKLGHRDHVWMVRSPEDKARFD